MDITLCGFPVDLDKNAPVGRIVLAPSVLHSIEENTLFGKYHRVDEFEALKSLYHAILEMSESGIGYSPATSDAMKKLKQIPSLQP